MPTKPESLLRQEFAAVTSSKLLITWHEDREINPGVPDVSFVMRTGNHETGWLELKAERITPTRVSPIKFRIEPSQHQWFAQHVDRVPLMFLVAVNTAWYVVPGRYHKELARGVTLEWLQDNSPWMAAGPMFRTTLADFLGKATERH